MSQSNEFTKLFKSRQTVLELLKDQGFNVTNYENVNASEVSIMYENNQMDMLVENTNGKKAYVKYHLAKTLRGNNIQDYIEDLFNIENLLKTTDDFIIIVKDEPNESLIKAVNKIWEQDGVFVVVHSINRLQFNVMKHELVPPHRILNEAETRAFKQNYKITDPSQIPDIGRFSPVALAIGMRPGNICEIIRPSKTAVETLFYRVCAV